MSPFMHLELKELEKLFYGLSKVKSQLENDFSNYHDLIELNDLLHDQLKNENQFIKNFIEDLKPHIHNSDSIQKTQEVILSFMQHKITKMENRIRDLLEGKE